MSNVSKSHSILRNNVSGGFYVVSGKVLGSNEHEMLARQAMAEDEQRIRDEYADADAAVKNTIDKGREIVARARSEAQELVSSARKQGFSKGYDEGFRQGISEGTQMSNDEKQPLIDALSQLSQRLFEYYDRPSSKNEYLDSAFELAQRIISIELAKNDDAFFGLYKKAAMHISNVDKASLKVGPRGYSAVQAEKNKFESAIEGLSELKTTLVGNDDGLCLLETSLGNIDASVAAQLSRAKKIISPQG